jgi:hypothetical protein
MSRSNPTDGIRNPSTRWFEFASGADGGFVRYYDKDAEKNVELGDAKEGGKFLFILLDELATVKGWHDASESAIYANEVRDTRQDALVVKAFKGGELASGLYAGIKDRIVAVGGHFVASCYIAYKDGDALRLGNIRFKGAGPWACGWTSRSNAPRRKTRPARASRATTLTPCGSRGLSSRRKAARPSACPFSTRPAFGGHEQASYCAGCRAASVPLRLSEAPARRSRSAAAKDDQPSNKNDHFDDMKDDKPWEETEARRQELDEDIPF